METPHLPKTLFAKDFESVYEPAEDTFLMLDALEDELSLFRDRCSVCLECGSGSGTIITAISKCLGSNNQPPRLLIATDINLEACKTTRKCANYHNQNSIQVVRTDLAEALVDRLEHVVDLLVFNPPYVPTNVGETENASQRQLYLSWAGGEDGRVVINKFLESYVPRLLSKPNGSAYMVALDKNQIPGLLTILQPYNIRGSIVKERRAGIELLYIIKYEWF